MMKNLYSIKWFRCFLDATNKNHFGNRVVLLPNINSSIRTLNSRKDENILKGSFGEYDSFNTHVKYVTFLLYHDMHD